MTNRNRWAAHYRRFGCLCCHKRKQPYGRHGLCGLCAAQITQRLEAIVGQKKPWYVRFWGWALEIDQ